jgi:hypothetical protein
VADHPANVRKGNNRLDSSGPKWDHETRRIWSLWDIMNAYEIRHLCTVMFNFGGLLSGLDVKRAELGDIQLPDDSRNNFDAVLDSSKTLCGELQFIESLDIIIEAKKWLREVQRPTIGMLEVQLRNVHAAISREVKKWKFVRIPDKAISYFEQERLFGDEVYSGFPDARADIKDAGNCIATELPTAAMFHLMRASEYGLRRLAHKLKVKLTHKGKNHPIDYADWEKVITGIKNKIADSRQLPHGSRREERLSMYSDAADHCTFVKDIWRNNLSHTRSPYRTAEAIAAFERIRDFLKFLQGSLK